MNRMNNQSSLKVYKSGDYEYIYIYYKLKTDILRINTRNQVIKNGMTKDLLYNSKVENYRELNKKTIELKKLVDNYIRIKLEEYRPSVKQKELESILNNRNKKILLEVSDKTGINSIDKLLPNRSIEHDKNNLNNLYEEFFNFKKKQLNNSLGIKQYKSLYNSLVDYQTYHKIKLRIEDVNSMDFLLDFRNFLSEERSKTDEYKTEGNLGNNTIDKRLKCLFRFYRYVEGKTDLRFSNEVYDVKVEKYKNDVISLSNEEIKKLYNLDITKKNWRKIIDTFVCNCYLGLRFSDLATLTPHDLYQDKDGDFYFIKYNEKTGIKVEIPIMDSFPLEILRKYNYKFPMYCNQYFNRELKKVFQHYEMFTEMVSRKRKKINQMEVVRKHKWELIGSHTCRRTFINLSIKNKIPFNTIMHASGHLKLSTLEEYISRVSDKQAFSGLSTV